MHPTNQQRPQWSRPGWLIATMAVANLGGYPIAHPGSIITLWEHLSRDRGYPGAD